MSKSFVPLIKEAETTSIGSTGEKETAIKSPSCTADVNTGTERITQKEMKYSNNYFM
jgi:hypothetical protein